MSDSPVQTEAEGIETIDVTYGGQTYTFPASLDDAAGDVLEAFEDQKLSRMLRGLLAPSQWERFKATKPKVKDYTALTEAYFEAAGLGTSGG